MKQGLIIDEDGCECYYVDDILHNNSDPAHISYGYNGSKRWYKKGHLHREDGPAIEYNTGQKSWWYNGQYAGGTYTGYTQEQFEAWKRFKAFI